MYSPPTTHRTKRHGHCQFGHIGYTGLQKLYDQQLVDGLKVDARSPKPDCIAYTKGKLTVKPFDQPATCMKNIGQLTHIDLWGKYDTSSIHS